VSPQPSQPPADEGTPEPDDGTDRTAQAAPSSAPAAGTADRIWHSPAAGLPASASTGSASRPPQGETGAASKPAAGGTYRVLTGEITERSWPATGGSERSRTGDTTAPSSSGPGDAERQRNSDTAALADGDHPGRQSDMAALPRRTAASREARPAIGGMPAPRRPGGGGAGSARSAADGNGDATRTPGTAPPGAYAPLIGDAAALRANWQRVQGDFVDDPRAAVSDAADLVEHAAQVLAGALRQRQKELRGLWDGPLPGGAAAPREIGWPAGGSRRGGWTRRRRLSPGRDAGEGRFGARLGDDGRGMAARQGDVSTRADDGYRPPDGTGSPDGAGLLAGDGLADGPAGTASAPVTDMTEYLRLVMQRYRALFNQICRP
jgi:hypothetical protein